MSSTRANATATMCVPPHVACFELREPVITWATKMLTTCNLQADIELFSKVMRGDCSEAVLRQQMRMLRDIRKRIEALTLTEDHGKMVPVPGAPTKDQILQVCREYSMLANFRQSCFEQLKDKLDTDSPGNGPVNWKKLFVRTSHWLTFYSHSSRPAEQSPLATSLFSIRW